MPEDFDLICVLIASVVTLVLLIGFTSNWIQGLLTLGIISVVSVAIWVYFEIWQWLQWQDLFSAREWFKARY